VIKCNNSQVNIKTLSKRERFHEAATTSTSGVVAKHMATLRFFKEIAENSTTHLINLRPIEEKLSHRVLRHTPILEDPVLRSVQAAEGEPALGDELSNCIHHALDGHSRHLHLLKVGVQIESCCHHPDGAIHDAPVAAPLTHKFEEGSCVHAAVAEELLRGRIGFRLQALIPGLLQNLDAPL
jgi:hypothetical protein